MFELRPYNHRNRIIGCNPMRDIEEMERRFFEDPFDVFGNNYISQFKTDVKDKGKEYVLEADLPGFKKEDIKIDIEDNMLIISAKRHSEFEDKDKKESFIRCERSYGTYKRSFDISGIEENKIKAKYNDGVLKLILPKKGNKSLDKKHLEIE